MDVHLTDHTVELVDRDDFKRFALVTDLDRSQLLARIAAVEGLSIADDAEHVWVAPELVTRLAAVGGEPSPAWVEGLSAMVTYADTQGWTSTQGICAHVERP